MPVTAQDFINLLRVDVKIGMTDWTKKEFYALLSQARQEARREALCLAPLDDCRKQDAIDELITAAHNYHSDMSKWNGDYDGPMERAEERLGDAIDSVLERLTK